MFHKISISNKCCPFGPSNIIQQIISFNKNIFECQNFKSILEGSCNTDLFLIQIKVDPKVTP